MRLCCCKIKLYKLLTSTSCKLLIPAKEKNIKIEVECDDKNVKILGEVNSLSRVLYNFIDNAIKFSYNNSQIKIKVQDLDRKIKISIINTGDPIDDEIIGDIWDRYYKSSKSGGIGLGLPICSEILKLHNFQYGAKNSKNSLTEFYFYADKSYL